MSYRYGWWQRLGVAPHHQPAWPTTIPIQQQSRQQRVVTGWFRRDAEQFPIRLDMKQSTTVKKNDPAGTWARRYYGMLQCYHRRETGGSLPYTDFGHLLLCAPVSKPAFSELSFHVTLATRIVCIATGSSPNSMQMIWQKNNRIQFERMVSLALSQHFPKQSACNVGRKQRIPPFGNDRKEECPAKSM